MVGSRGEGFISTGGHGRLGCASMSRPIIEQLEPRCLLSASTFFSASSDGMIGPQLAAAPAAASAASSAAVRLTKAQINGIIARAALVSLRSQAIAVVDRNGNVLAIFGQTPSAANLALPVGAPPSENTVADYAIVEAIKRARTAALFESRQDAFSTRTARFIIQDQFPWPISNTGGGPLYGVEFSDLPGADVLPPGQGSGLSGDPGGLPLYINGIPVGGIGVAGDGHDVAVRPDLVAGPGTIASLSNPGRLVFNGQEEPDFDESVALVGQAGFAPPSLITADKIVINGLRFPYTTQDPPATQRPVNRVGPLLAAVGDAGPMRTLQAFPAVAKPTANVVTSAAYMSFPEAVVAGTPGQVKNTNPEAQGTSFVPGNPSANSFGYIPADDPALAPQDRLTVADVNQIITQAVVEANSIRAGIRQPVGVPVKVHIAVTDLDGDVLGVFRMFDGTNFSYDVAVQKARTAAYFSDDTHAFTPRAIGFIGQALFPPGQENGKTGPLFHLQNVLSSPANLGPTLPNGQKNPLADGITIFPGGAPLYKNGHLVGAIGVSGDGVDEDDLIAFTGTTGYAPPPGARSDQLGNNQVISFLTAKVNALPALGFTFPNGVFTDDNPSVNIIQLIDQRLADGLDGVRLPYVKFPRNPEL